MGTKKKKKVSRSTRPGAAVFALAVVAGMLLGNSGLSMMTGAVATDQNLPWLKRAVTTTTTTGKSVSPSIVGAPSVSGPAVVKKSAKPNAMRRTTVLTNTSAQTSPDKSGVFCTMLPFMCPKIAEVPNDLIPVEAPSAPQQPTVTTTVAQPRPVQNTNDVSYDAYKQFLQQTRGAAPTESPAVTSSASTGTDTPVIITTAESSSNSTSSSSDDSPVVIAVTSLIPPTLIPPTLAQIAKIDQMLQKQQSNSAAFVPTTIETVCSGDPKFIPNWITCTDVTDVMQVNPDEPMPPGIEEVEYFPAPSPSPVLEDSSTSDGMSDDANTKMMNYLEWLTRYMQNPVGDSDSSDEQSSDDASVFENGSNLNAGSTGEDSGTHRAANDSNKSAGFEFTNASSGTSASDGSTDGEDNGGFNWSAATSENTSADADEDDDEDSGFNWSDSGGINWSAGGGNTSQSGFNWSNGGFTWSQASVASKASVSSGAVQAQ